MERGPAGDLCPKRSQYFVVTPINLPVIGWKLMTIQTTYTQARIQLAHLCDAVTHGACANNAY